MRRKYLGRVMNWFHINFIFRLLITYPTCCIEVRSGTALWSKDGQKLGENWKCHLWKATLVKLQRVQTNFVPSKTKPRQQNKWLLFFWVCSAYLFRQKLSWKNLELSSAKVAWFLLELQLFWKTCMDMAKFAKS